MTGKLFSALCACRKGVATIEAALILPVLAALTLGAADAGLMMLTIHKLETGLASGGAYLSRSNDPDTDKAIAIRVAVTGYAETGHTAIVKGWSESDVIVSIQEVDNSGLDQSLVLRGDENIKIARFQTSISYTGLGFLGMVNAGNTRLTATHEERIFGGAG